MPPEAYNKMRHNDSKYISLFIFSDMAQAKIIKLMDGNVLSILAERNRFMNFFPPFI
jgi:hypothetical protein